ncbi:MAG: lipid-A-disaccharide synthase [Candidatus Omnitrophica bacterium]|nr:lipid-A-disaccharide synthase [Candidatus Omnitrophota bacterium]
MDRTPQKILIVAGEESGDMRAAPLVRAIHTYAPDIRFIGIGGERLRQAGVATFADINELAVIGFTEVLIHYPRIKRIFDMTVKKLQEERPDAVLLVDYPGFNLRLAEKAKKLGIKVIYYVSPQVWAWKESRVKLIKRVVDRMIVLFPFEKEFYAKHGYEVDFVGHPLVDENRADKGASDFLKSIGLNDKAPTLALLPGSRNKEVSRHLPPMLEAAILLKKDHPKLQIILLQAKNLNKEIFDKPLKKAPHGLIVSRDYYNALNAADLCVVASGTATLETGILGKPMAVIYKTSWLTFLIARLVIRIPYISLVNIVAGKKIVEELLQQHANPKKIAKVIDDFLRNPEKARATRKELAGLKTKLGSPGASQRAAKIILTELGKSSH